MFLEHLQGLWFHHLPGQLFPEPDQYKPNWLIFEMSAFHKNVKIANILQNFYGITNTNLLKQAAKFPYFWRYTFLLLAWLYIWSITDKIVWLVYRGKNVFLNTNQSIPSHTDLEAISRKLVYLQSFSIFCFVVI